MNNTYLAHHGVLGMKWGVRRYQNSDGSLTRKGLEHYRSAESKYNTANDKYKKTKKAYKSGTASKGDLKRAKAEKKYSKKILNKSYDQLKNDKLADKGKELYFKGKTITGNEHLKNVAATVATGAATVSTILYKNGYQKPALAVTAAALGAEATAGILAGKNVIQARKLRAYYGHSRPKFESSLSKDATRKNIEINKASKYDNVYKRK